MKLFDPMAGRFRGRFLFLAVLLFFVSRSVVSSSRQKRSLDKTRIYSLKVFSDIKFRFATTLVTSRVLNPNSRSLEALFDVVLPNQAFISNFTLEIQGKVYPGQVKEKEAAQKQYDTAKRKGQSAGQVKQQPKETNRFRVEINVAANEKVTFNLTYQEVLERRKGLYQHVVYINPGQPVEELSVEVAIEESQEITTLFVPPLRDQLLTDVDLTATQTGVQISRPFANRAVIRYNPSPQDQVLSSASGLDGLFTVHYDVHRDINGGDLLLVNGYFVHFFAPPLVKAVPKDVIFTLDTSGSMHGRKLEQMMDAMQVILKDMTEKDRFAVMQFNTHIIFWEENLVYVSSSNIKRAQDYISGLRNGGYTNMNKALLDSFEFLSRNSKGNRKGMVVFLTDGQASAGEENSEKILRNVQKANTDGQVPLFGLSFGEDADWDLLKKLAVQNNGVARRIYENSQSELQIKGFYEEISSLLLTDIKARYLDDAVEPELLTKSSFGSYFNGSELVIAGKLTDTFADSLVVSMEAKNEEGNIQLTSTSKGLDLDTVTSSQLMASSDLGVITEKMWAYLTLKQVLKERVGEEDAEKAAALKQKAVDLSLKYGFVTPVTSMVVTKPDKSEEGDLQEDDSELHGKDDLRSRHGGSGGGGGGGYSRGGGGGDPHFMVELSSLHFPICFELDGFAGEVYQLIRDPTIGLTVNIELGEGKERQRGPIGNHYGSKYRVYIFRVAVVLGDVVMRVTRNHIYVNDRRFSWTDTWSQQVRGARVLMSRQVGVLRFVLDSGAEIDLKRFVHTAVTPLGSDFLNVEVEKEHLLSQETDGVLGQFVHQKIKMKKLKRSRKWTIAYLESRSGNEIHFGRAFLKERRNPFFNISAPCLTLWRKRGMTLMDHPTLYYRVPHLLYV